MLEVVNIHSVRLTNVSQSSLNLLQILLLILVKLSLICERVNKENVLRKLHSVVSGGFLGEAWKVYNG